MTTDISLDDLLAESTTLAEAKRAVAQKRRLTPEQEAVLEANNLAADAAIWRDGKKYLVIESLWCEGCGDNYQALLGQFTYQEQRGASKLHSRRLLKTSDVADAPDALYFVNREVKQCAYCAVPHDLPLASEDECDLLKCL